MCLSMQVFTQGLQKVIVEKYYVSNVADSIGSAGLLPVGSTTYRVYVDMKPGYKFQVVYGVVGHELRLSSTTSFFNNTDFGANDANSISLTNNKKSTVMLDSWISVGGACAGRVGVLKTVDSDGSVGNTNALLQNADTAAGIAVKTKDGLMPGTIQAVTTLGIDAIIGVWGDGSSNGNLFSTNDGGWSALSGAIGLDTNNRVLIGQFTTEGIFSFQLNVQIGTPLGGTEQYVAMNPVSSEKLLSSLNYTSNAAPKVSITGPAQNTNFVGGNTVTIDARASDADGTISKVEFFVNNVKIGEDTSSPYSLAWASNIGGADTLKVVATDDKGLKAASKPVYILVNGVSVDEKMNIKTEVSAYPIPTEDFVNLKITSSEKAENVFYSIFDILGNKIIESYDINVNSENKIHLNNLSNGNYIIQVNLNDKKYFVKVVKK